MNEELMWISDAEVREIITPAMAYESVMGALLCHHSNDYDQPLKPYVRPGGRESEWKCGRLITMPGYVGGAIRALGVKVIAGFPSNVERGLPRASGLVCLHDIETGVPVCVMDCRTVSAQRTAAVAAICVDYLATRQPRRVGVLGAGPIAKAVILALLAGSRQIESIHVFDPRTERVVSMAEDISLTHGWSIVMTRTEEECVKSSNVIVTATTGAYGYLKRSWLQGDWLLVALSLDDCEPEVLLAADKVICDDFGQGNREEKLLHRLTRDQLFSEADLYAELGDIVSGTRAGREGLESIYANCMGMAIEDLALAQQVYQAKARMGNQAS